jgi:release factor glutamine methyltransferase
MKTIKDVFVDFKQSLNNVYDINESEAITLLTISDICNLTKAKIKAFPELELPADQTEKLDHILAELKSGKPIQYILGKTEFYGLPFKVNSSVLIPRPETEELVEWVLASVSNKQLAGNILDIGTGSGCIAISLKKNLPRFNVSAMDISPGALQTAKENAKLNNIDIEFIEADVLDLPFLSHVPNLKSQISIIVSNPPYVTLHDKSQMHKNVTDFEPHNALFVPEDDPLLFYKAIADFATTNLVKNGLLFFEINENYGNEIVELLSNRGFKAIELRKDMSNRDRMVMASLK